MRASGHVIPITQPKGGAHPSVVAKILAQRLSGKQPVPAGVQCLSRRPAKKAAVHVQEDALVRPAPSRKRSVVATVQEARATHKGCLPTLESLALPAML